MRRTIKLDPYKPHLYLHNGIWKARCVAFVAHGGTGTMLDAYIAFQRLFNECTTKLPIRLKGSIKYIPTYPVMVIP